MFLFELDQIIGALPPAAAADGALHVTRQKEVLFFFNSVLMISGCLSPATIRILSAQHGRWTCCADASETREENPFLCRRLSG